MRPQRSRSGLSALEVIVVIVLVGVVALLILLALPRQRETARVVSCRQNLMQIGKAVALYDETAGRLPVVPTLEDRREDALGPLGLMLMQLGTAEFANLQPETIPPAGKIGTRPTVRRIRGLVCPSDPNAIQPDFPAPVSYRANTGDTVDGRHGPFSPGKNVTLADVEAGDGTSYTASFTERLLGNGRKGVRAPINYATVPGPVRPAGCPDAPAESWMGDAGASWALAGWPSTLYNHAMPPGASPSCVAEDGGSARMGASSGHVEGVHLLMLDGSVRNVTRDVNVGVWRKFGNAWDSAPPAAPTPLPDAEKPASPPEP